MIFIINYVCMESEGQRIEWKTKKQESPSEDLK
jgi:hypothetical protein